jgi:type VI secretion system secreted protein Hcp
MAAVDYFLKIDSIQGESQDDKHKNEIDVESWSWGETQQGTQSGGGGGGAGKVSMQDFHFVMKVNKASPLLFSACATGQHIPTALLTCRKAGTTGQEYLTWSFTNLLISSYQTGGTGGAANILPVDQISFNYQSVTVSYKVQAADGTLGGAVTKGYDLKSNKAS